MGIDSPHVLRAFLAEHGIHPKKSLSQNFLIDQNIVKKIVRAADIHPNDAILEVGPGPGVLTEALLHEGAHVLAVEKDTTFAQALERLQTPDHRLQVVESDILSFTLPKGKRKVVANLPYHITTPILERLVPRKDDFSTITIMIQEEVAKRFTAEPGSKDCGSISVFLQFYTHPRYLFRVNKTCFYPKPRVDSAVINLTLREPPKNIDPNPFFLLVRTAFQQRRKMLSSSLKTLFPKEKTHQALSTIGLSTTIRPEKISFNAWCQLYSLLLENSMT